mmetsp:Transcript_16746/g.24814  ORF Transcript_16746/g.24814 Transcript_16746/m.24814 type:complete len:213 (-) Transcript_16746:82-720(-)
MSLKLKKSYLKNPHGSSRVILRQKCIVVGNAAVGKSSLIRMYTCGGNFSESYQMTTSIALTLYQTQIPDSDVTVEQFLYDIPGDDMFHHQEQLSSSFCGNADFIVCIFDVSKRDSFRDCVKWCKQIVSVNAQVPVIIIANKIDLRPFEQTTLNDGPIEVDQDEALQFARQNGYEYFECSALGNQDVNLPFNYMASKASEKFDRGHHAGSIKS